jgi:hypothetical protein
MLQDFDDIAINIGGVSVMYVTGRFKTDSSGMVESIWLCDPIGMGHPETELSKTGIGRVIYHALAPLLRQAFAKQIADNIRFEHRMFEQFAAADKAMAAGKE